MAAPPFRGFPTRDSKVNSASRVVMHDKPGHNKKYVIKGIADKLITSKYSLILLNVIQTMLVQWLLDERIRKVAKSNLRTAYGKLAQGENG